MCFIAWIRQYASPPAGRQFPVSFPLPQPFPRSGSRGNRLGAARRLLRTPPGLFQKRDVRLKNSGVPTTTRFLPQRSFRSFYRSTDIIFHTLSLLQHCADHPVFRENRQTAHNSGNPLSQQKTGRMKATGRLPPLACLINLLSYFPVTVLASRIEVARKKLVYILNH